MPAPIAVDLVPYNPQWEEDARKEAARLAAALGESLVIVHHIGSTAVPGIRAKAILDLVPVFAAVSALDDVRVPLESLGYAWYGEYGLPGRRYCTLDDPVTGHRKVQLHGYLNGSAEITRHLAFRDYLRTRPDVAQAYDAEKARCRDLYPLDSHAYGDCKCDWIIRVQEDAMRARF